MESEGTTKSQPAKEAWKYDAKTVRYTLLDLLLYFVYLILVSIISFGTISQSTYIMANMLTKQMVVKPFDLNYADDKLPKQDEVTFAELTAVHELWAFLQSQLLDTVYGEPGETESPQTMAFFANRSENLLLAPVRIRQLRVRNATCVVHKLFRQKFRECYGTFSSGNEDRKPFGLEIASSAWEYNADPEGIFHWGHLASYPSGGYWLELSMDRKRSEHELALLQNNSWIDLATRVVMVEFALYNANLNLVCVAKLVGEVPPSGGVFTYASFVTTRMMSLLTTFDYVVAVSQVLFLLLTLWRTVETALRMWRLRCAYWKMFWNWVDLLICVLAYISVILTLYRMVRLSQAMEHRKSTEEPLNLDRVAFTQVLYSAALAACVFLVWLKLFQRLSFNRTLWQLSETLARCAWDLLAFALMFLIVFVAFAQLGYAMFGTENADFRTFGTTMMTLWRTVLGDFDYLAMEKANRVLGPIYFVTYIFLVFFVLLNMFLAIINDAYADVKTGAADRRDAGVGWLHVKRYLRGKLVAMCKKCKCCKKCQLKEEVVEEEPDIEEKSSEPEIAKAKSEPKMAPKSEPKIEPPQVATPAPLDRKSDHQDLQLQGLHLQDIFAYDSSQETYPIKMADDSSIPLEGVQLRDIFVRDQDRDQDRDPNQQSDQKSERFERMSDSVINEHAAAVNADWLRRLELLEQAMDHVVVNLNDILVIVHDFKTRQRAEEPPPDSNA